MAWWTAAVAHMQLSLALLNKSTAHARLIVQAHEIADTLEETSWPIRLYSRLMGGLLMRLADAVAVHSESVRTQLASTYRLDPRKVFVKPFGLYDVYHREHGREAARAKLGVHERFTILHFGSMRPYKGIPVLIDAFSRLPEEIAKNCRLVLAGKHWGDPTGVREKVESSPYHDHITFQPHFVPDDMVSWYFSAADLVPLPYLRTCGSGVASIAMAYGKPVVASDHETLRELLEGYDGATFVTTGDVAQLSLALRDGYERSVSDGNNVFDAPQRSWHEVVHAYERIIRGLDG
jgi:glycosyltransferase involved in cell wall biosynthesis